VGGFIAHLTSEQRSLVDDLIDQMNPVAARSAGVAFDNQARLPDERIAGVRAPTLILHAKDDGLQLFRNAEFAAAHIPGAELVPFETGGHLLLSVHRGEVRRLTQKQIVENLGK
jgi:2-hydroxy-6-oxonona-2,4-dienedioate hydrolase